MSALLEVEDLRIRLGGLELLRGLSFSLAPGETLGLIGESGSGKTLTALALMGLLPEGAELAGRLRFAGQDLLALDERGWCALRGGRIAMVFQEPMTALNPLHRVGRQVAEPLRLQRRLPAAAAQAEAGRLLARVGLDEQAAQRYPHQLSGGQRQRVMIAIALAAGPQLLIADEPTTALDASLQGQVLELLAGLVAERGMGLLMISHDMALIARQVQRLVVMYAGQAVDSGPTAAVLTRQAHPYTRALLAARPRLGVGRGQRLAALPGQVPAPGELRAGAGCSFRPRCPLAAEICRQDPAPVAVEGHAHWIRCLRAGEALHRG
ncbi:ABC transporter ATP-binding protein [Roseateles violae]|uniref:ABC transporter ATP-binding protein n=1 Tax=Roseateles violae TaxID=3058042 RepID=A0ABT8DM45_9BURK|nr:ABC transporter ATP-binding protein [Pelomonas sp. PFR6]MDN3919465.1 ABC transporter ATP-binding protein [Pelomonas sp. PFR6]